jgi:hypothetical protein
LSEINQIETIAYSKGDNSLFSRINGFAFLFSFYLYFDIDFGKMDKKIVALVRDHDKNGKYVTYHE